MIYGLTPLGLAHTLISLAALAAGLVALVRDRQIVLGNALGKFYALTTAVTCVTGFGIFQHGGFGKPHALGVLTLIVLGIALLASRGVVFGKASRQVEVVALSATLLFHLIPGITETATRLPLGAPLLPNADAPQLQAAAGVLAVLFLIVATLQVLRLRRGA